MVDIVIVNWNSREYLRNCVKSILAKENEEDVGKIIIIDNASTDESLSLLPVHAKILVIQNRENVGFSKACNQGFKLCKAFYTLLLNPDTQLLKATLAECIFFMKKNKLVDILGCQLLDDKREITYSCARFPTPARFFYDSIGLSKIAPTLFKPAILMTDWNHKESRKVDQVMGAFMFMKTSIFKKYGYFDEQFFVYYEELDFSKRVASAGGVSYYNAFINSIHSGQGTTGNVKAFRLFLNLRSRLQYAKKHFGVGGYFIVWICTYCIEVFTRSIFLLIRGNFKEIRETYKGYWLLLNS
ncbi:MAG: glycosyltransferase family 2 protein [Bacteroidota bacterium]|nr:glycosyltransferase family 2 protein [Bacteroidota bacterium]